MTNSDSDSMNRALHREVAIPTEHLLAHDYCLRLHNQIVRLTDHGFENGLFNLRLRLSDREHQQWRELDFQPWEWLEKYGRAQELGELLLKSLFPALAIDFSQFILEALLCSERGMLAVTFALLRKPLQQNLLLLEWLLGDPEGFLNVFYNNEPRDLASKLDDRDPERLKRIIGTAIQRLPERGFYGANWQHDIRFDLKCPYGLAGLCHQAIHLVTNAPEIATERRNFNFVFASGDVHRELWRLLYSVLPFVLYHAASVCETLMAVATHTIIPDRAPVALERTLGLILFADDLQGESGRPFRALEIACPACGAAGSLDRALATRLYSEGSVPCPACSYSVTLANLAGLDSDDPSTEPPSK